jgi:MoaA/NifB/PqqE/SkfB family radical SAM enzyme
MKSGFLASRVIQLHPTLRCNLACPHCYSSSGPRAGGELAASSLIERLAALRAEGYDIVSFSGGEPLVYRDFDETAVAAHRLGFRVNLITNAILLDEDRVARLAEFVSMVGLSLDGVAERHDRMRGRVGCFEKLEACIPLLRDHDIPFGFAHCVTTESIADLPWLLEYAIEQGASLVQLHPLTMSGRAASTCASLALSAADLDRLYVLAGLLRIQAEGKLVVQLDLAAVRHVLAEHSSYAVLGTEPGESLAETPLADLVNPLVIDERGHLWPLSYGMADDQCLTAALDGDWRATLEHYKRGGAARLRWLLSSALARLENDAETRFIDWYGYLAEHSHELAARRAA